jgi:NAD(P)H-dependent FMN reductase
MSDDIKVALIYGSVREGRFGDIVGRWVTTEIAKRSEFSLDVIDPGTLNVIPHTPTPKDLSEHLQERIGITEAFVILTPEYNHGYPAALKFLIDSVNRPWRAKPVSFVSYGGISGGLRAVEQLRLVFAELHAITLRDTVSFANAWTQFDADGKLLNPELAEQAMALMLTRLSWWAHALRAARNVAPYDQAAA